MHLSTFVFKFVINYQKDSLAMADSTVLKPSDDLMKQSASRFPSTSLLTESDAEIVVCHFTLHHTILKLLT